jgi:Flp pilus assembly CpaF family ATPase
VGLAVPAGSGLGRAIARALAEDGWSVALLGRTRAALEETSAAGGSTLVPPTDVTDERQVDQIAVADLRATVEVNLTGTRRGRSELTTTILGTGELADLVERMLRTSGRRVDMSTPFVDAMMPDGSRLHVVIPDITRRHMAVNVRKFVLQAASLDELVALETLTAQAARTSGSCGQRLRRTFGPLPTAGCALIWGTHSSPG